MVAVVAQGRIAVVGQQLDQLVGAVPGPSDQPEGGAACAGVVQEPLLGCRSATKTATALATMERSCCNRDTMRRISSDSYSRSSSGGTLRSRRPRWVRRASTRSLNSATRQPVAVRFQGRRVLRLAARTASLVVGSRRSPQRTGAGFTRVRLASWIIWWVKLHSLSTRHHLDQRAVHDPWSAPGRRRRRVGRQRCRRRPADLPRYRGCPVALGRRVVPERVVDLLGGGGPAGVEDDIGDRPHGNGRS